MNSSVEKTEKENTKKIEIKLLLDAIFLKYGYDFRDYSGSHLERRIQGRLIRSNLKNIAELQHKILHNPDFFHTFLLDLSLNVTEMFRDPSFFAIIRENIIPVLKTYPYIKIWHAGCSSGEEVYSMAILLHEENLLDRTTIYATDFNQMVLNKAKEAIYPLDRMKIYAENYYKANGKTSLTDYFTISYGAALLNGDLKKNIVFSDHNLVTDGVFGEMNMIVCRNVLIYFNQELQEKVHNLFYNSLVQGGYLCLGSKESLIFSPFKDFFNKMTNNIFKKMYKA